MAMNLLTMPTLHVGQGTHLGGLSVFPVWTDAPIMSGLDTGRAARVQAAEREGSPVVGELVLKNQGAKPALLVAGELFEGGWQHRALNHDILLMAGQQAGGQRVLRGVRPLARRHRAGATVPPGLDDGPLGPDPGGQ
jgi:hypothetical protein